MGLLCFFIVVFLLDFYPCKLPRVTKSKLGGHIIFLK